METIEFSFTGEPSWKELTDKYDKQWSLSWPRGVPPDDLEILVTKKDRNKYLSLFGELGKKSPQSLTFRGIPIRIKSNI